MANKQSSSDSMLQTHSIMTCDGLCSVWMHRIGLGIELAMEYQINDFNGIP